MGTLLGGNRYPSYRPGYGSYPGVGYPGVGGGYPGVGGAYPGIGGYPGVGGGAYPGAYPGGGYGTNFIGNGGNGYGGFGGNNGLNSYSGYSNKDYRGGGNLGYGYYSDVFENRNTQPQSIPSGYRGYN